MFLDESGAYLGLTRRYARSPKGERAVDSAPRRRDGKVSLIAAITPQGLDLEQCLVHPGAVDTKAFLTYLAEVLVPSLRPGQLIFMDNFTVHHNKDVRKLIEAAGCYLAYLPTYSPDFNPIEMIFAKVKAFLRKLRAWQTDDLIKAIGQALAAVSPHEVRACFEHCGYL